MEALISISIVLAVMLAGIWRKVGLDLTILAGVVLTSILFGRAASLPYDAAATIMDGKTVELMLLIYMVFLLNGILSSAGAMKKVVESLENMVSDPRVTITAIPMLIGLMPVPSGAVISAPFADEIGRKYNLSKERRHVINYWFRHISEYVNPIYPGVLLATGLIGISFPRFFIANLPVMAAYALAGTAFLVLTIRNHSPRPKRLHAADIIGLGRGVLPIFTAVVLPVLFKLDLILSLAVAVTLAVILNGKAWGHLVRISGESLKWDLIVLVFLVMLFKTILDESQATQEISSSLIALGAPTAALLIIIPLLVGFLTGLTIGYVGLTFPILMPFLAPGGQPDMGAVTLAFVSGYMGILISPMHLCYTVTQKYFKADLRESYRLLMPPLAITFLFTLAYVAFI
jgi:uncharacterized protein